MLEDLIYQSLAKRRDISVVRQFPVIRLTGSYRTLVMLRPTVDSMLVDGGENGSSLKALAGAVSVCRDRICLGLELFGSENRG